MPQHKSNFGPLLFAETLFAHSVAVSVQELSLEHRPLLIHTRSNEVKVPPRHQRTLYARRNTSERIGSAVYCVSKKWAGLLRARNVVIVWCSLMMKTVQCHYTHHSTTTSRYIVTLLWSLLYCPLGHTCTVHGDNHLYVCGHGTSVIALLVLYESL